LATPSSDFFAGTYPKGQKLNHSFLGKAGSDDISNIKKIRHALSEKDHIKISNESDTDQGLKCPSCQNGTMVTFLVIDGYGNVVMDGLPDPVMEHEPYNFIHCFFTELAIHGVFSF